MVIVQGKPMLWVIVADPPCILIPPPTEKGIGLICSVVHSSGNRVWRRVKRWGGTRCVWQFWVSSVMEGIHQTKDIASCRWPAPRGSPPTDIQMNRFQPQSASIDLTFCFLLSTIQKNHRGKKWWADNTCGATGGSGWPVGDIQMNRLAARPRVAPFHAGPPCSTYPPAISANLLILLLSLHFLNIASLVCSTNIGVSPGAW